MNEWVSNASKENAVFHGHGSYNLFHWNIKTKTPWSVDVDAHFSSPFEIPNLDKLELVRRELDRRCSLYLDKVLYLWCVVNENDPGMTTRLRGPIIAIGRGTTYVCVRWLEKRAHFVRSTGIPGPSINGVQETGWYRKLVLGHMVEHIKIRTLKLEYQSRTGMGWTWQACECRR